MKLKGLVWFFTIALILISVWELSYTFVVRSYESKVEKQAERLVKKRNPGLTGESFRESVEATKEHILDSTRDVKIYPLVGTTYQKCKEYELNLGLDLQGGMSATLDVSLEGLLRSLSNNPQDPALKRAIETATAEKVKSDENYIRLFANAYARQNGPNRLNALFAGPGKTVKVTDDDKAVTAKLEEVGKTAILQTYDVLRKRIDKFGVAQPNINLDENRGVINVELAGITNKERVVQYLQSSANLQFWSVKLLRDQDFQSSLTEADKSLARFLKTTDTALAKRDTADGGILGTIVGFSIDKNNQIVDMPEFGRVLKKDTSLLNNYLNNPAFTSVFSPNIKIMYGQEEKGAKGESMFGLYAVEKIPGSDKAPLEGESVAESYQSYNEKGQPSIKMDMTALGSKLWSRLTEKNNQRFVAISLDDMIYSAPRVNGKIEGGSTEISGAFTVQSAQDLANILKTGKLDAPAKIVASQEVGPTLGQEAIRGGGMAFLISFLVIFILMLVYYNTAGWIANIALIFNLLFTVGVLAMFGFTLTAAGIAGLVLTIGIAVDTNVIIFERIKEELTKGKSYPQAVSDGYRRSLAPVLDAHVTSLLTAIILLFFGLGPVLGFATTQIIGILLSLFCGILLSRLITDLRTDKNHHFNYFTNISRKIFRHANFDFIGKRKIAYGISAIVLIAGLASFFHGFHQGVEFKGGRSFTVRFDQAVQREQVADDLHAAFDNDNPVIKNVQDNRHLNVTTSYLKGVDGADSLVQQRLFSGLKKVLPAGLSYADFSKKYMQSRTTVQPTISEDLKRGAVKATIGAMLIIFIYIFIRFRDWRYSLGTIVTLLHDVLITLAVFSFFKDIVPFPLEIDQHFIAAILTVIGFSMNDTVIVFDRVREYSRDMRGTDKKTILNRALNDTLSRTIMTSLTVFLTVVILFIFGSEVTRGFAFAMMIGVLTGTYSSIFVGAPILIDVAKDKPLGAASEVKTKKVKAPEL